MKRTGFSLVELLVVVAIVSIVAVAFSMTVRGALTRRHVKDFPDNLATMISSMPAIARAKQEPVHLVHNGNRVYLVLDSAPGTSLALSIRVPPGVSLPDGTLFTADERGRLSGPNNPLPIQLDGRTFYLHVSLAGDSVMNTEPGVGNAETTATP